MKGALPSTEWNSERIWSLPLRQLLFMGAVIGDCGVGSGCPITRKVWQ